MGLPPLISFYYPLLTAGDQHSKWAKKLMLLSGLILERHIVGRCDLKILGFQILVIFTRMASRSGLLGPLQVALRILKFCQVGLEGEIASDTLSTFQGKHVNSELGTTLKVPSVISYEKGVTKWGYQVEPLREAIRGSKLLLDESQAREYAPSLASKSLLGKYGKTAVHASGEFIGHLVLHVKDTLQRRFGDVAKSMRLKYVVTVPAVWSDKAKDATLQAAMIAGIETKQIYLVSEPEAAALHSLQTIQPNSVAVRSSLVIRNVAT